MHLSEERARNIAHKVWMALKNSPALKLVSPEQALSNIKDTLSFYQSRGGEIDQKVRAKINSLKRGVSPGSPEWEVLYRQYAEEEAKKLGF